MTWEFPEMADLFSKIRGSKSPAEEWFNSDITSAEEVVVKYF